MQLSRPRHETRDMTPVLSELVQWLCSHDGALQAVQVDTRANMYDAGYIDSMGAADLLVHVEDHYRVVVPEQALSGELATLERLAAQIVSERHDL
ncbi:MAG: acyl carrier protein [Pseudohongiellaceae bacterium]|jgi:acyl carrier protein